ncbi:hypothetical protein CIB48_g1929 [Xylaria polymorpha]|nr:hypothetical protein CIB48_g1929 [Xylaria polymorpha]
MKSAVGDFGKPVKDASRDVSNLKMFMNTATQNTQAKSPVRAAIMLADDSPTNAPILPIPKSKPRVQANPLPGADHQEKTLYYAT